VINAGEENNNQPANLNLAKHFFLSFRSFHIVYGIANVEKRRSKVEL
jgi:hypothetical protein